MERLFKGRKPRSREGAHGKHGEPLPGQGVRQGLHRLFLEEVHLVEGHEARPAQEGGVVGPNLLPEGLQGLKGFVCGVQHVEQDPGAGDVAQELRAQTLPSLAPSMIPGMSARVKRSSSETSTTPRLGLRVVKG